MGGSDGAWVEPYSIKGNGPIGVAIKDLSIHHETFLVGKGKGLVRADYEHRMLYFGIPKKDTSLYQGGKFKYAVPLSSLQMFEEYGRPMARVAVDRATEVRKTILGNIRITRKFGNRSVGHKHAFSMPQSEWEKIVQLMPSQNGHK